MTGLGPEGMKKLRNEARAEQGETIAVLDECREIRRDLSQMEGEMAKMRERVDRLERMIAAEDARA